jgi:transcriptional regulator of acetoin/glycerol metabolism
VVLRGQERLTLADLKEEWLAGPQQASPLAGAAEDSDCADGESALCGAEREALRRMLESCEWNVSAAAARLHISRRTIYRKIHRHGLLRHAALLAARMQESD